MRKAPRIPERTRPQPREQSPEFAPKSLKDGDVTREGTPLNMSLESILTVEHTNNTVHPYIKRDVKHAEQVSFDVWIAAVLKLDNSKLKSWIQHIKQHRWHEDSVVQDSLARFATAEKETARYEPLADLSNRILDMAKGHLPGVKSYPIDDIKMIRNDPSALNCIPEHGSLGAVRKPDLLLVRGEKLETSDSKVVKFDWTDVLKFSEVKAFQILADAYDELRRDRGLPDVDPHTLRAGGKTGKVNDYTDVSILVPMLIFVTRTAKISSETIV
ncbi:hypothetical protein EW026_g4103 [Hermanssonia centrifuga]|uniref:Fungal-type protein kinase domain-containing protein n=1 Tax=Hermanssonia centrifuga TaxID=98765 RepID=A0A4S4KI77_9APHY|nr:hypothetical protein EW026_g4103 [Hermanssonia centrifuga]